MGASNALSAYMLYAGKVPPLAMQCLIYMALVSKDADPRPWYGQGHDALAVHALGRPVPDESDLRAVRRAITPLLAARAIETDRMANARRAGTATVRYRLNLILTVGRKTSGEDPPTVGRKTSATVGRKTVDGRTKNGRRQDEKRPTEEEEETRGAKEDELVGFSTQPTTARAPTKIPEFDLGRRKPPKCPHGIRAQTRDGQSACVLCRRGVPTGKDPP